MYRSVFNYAFSIICCPTDEFRLSLLDAILCRLCNLKQYNEWVNCVLEETQVLYTKQEELQLMTAPIVCLEDLVRDETEQKDEFATLSLTPGEAERVMYHLFLNESLSSSCPFPPSNIPLYRDKIVAMLQQVAAHTALPDQIPSRHAFLQLLESKRDQLWTLKTSANLQAWQQAVHFDSLTFNNKNSVY